MRKMAREHFEKYFISQFCPFLKAAFPPQRKISPVLCVTLSVAGAAWAWLMRTLTRHTESSLNSQLHCTYYSGYLLSKLFNTYRKQPFFWGGGNFKSSVHNDHHYEYFLRYISMQAFSSASSQVRGWPRLSSVILRALSWASRSPEVSHTSSPCSPRLRLWYSSLNSRSLASSQVTWHNTWCQAMSHITLC